MTKLNTIPVKSSNIVSIGWDSQNKRLLVERKEGTYAYKAPRAEYDNLMLADSKGRYFNLNIRNKYEWEKL